MNAYSLSLTFFHILAVIAGFGGSLFMLFILVPMAKKSLPEEHFHKLVSKTISRFHPFLLLCYGVLVLTGAWILTDYKISTGVSYFSVYGKILGIKLLLVFTAIMVSSYQFFGLGREIGYLVEEAYESTEKSIINKKLKLMRYTSWVNVVLILTIISLGLVLSRT